MFVLDMPFQPSLMFVSKVRAYLSEAPLRCPLYGMLLALTTNIKQDRKDLLWTNMLANYCHSLIIHIQSLTTLGLGLQSLKLVRHKHASLLCPDVNAEEKNA